MPNPVDSMMPLQQRSAAGNLPSAKVTASWTTNLLPSSTATDSTNRCATRASNCTKICSTAILAVRPTPKAFGVARCHWARWPIVPRTELPCNFAGRPDVQTHIMSLLASFMNLAGPDLIVILLIILVLFGAKKLPELAKGMGQAVREFQKAKD